MPSVGLSAVAYALPERRLTVEQLESQGLLTGGASRLRALGFEHAHVSAVDVAHERVDARRHAADVAGGGQLPQPIDRDDDVQVAIGGRVVEAIGHVPDPGDRVVVDDLEVEVERVAHHAVVSVLVARRRPQEKPS